MVNKYRSKGEPVSFEPEEQRRSRLMGGLSEEHIATVLTLHREIFGKRVRVDSVNALKVVSDSDREKILNALETVGVIEIAGNENNRRIKFLRVPDQILAESPDDSVVELDEGSSRRIVRSRRSGRGTQGPQRSVGSRVSTTETKPKFDVGLVAMLPAIKDKHKNSVLYVSELITELGLVDSSNSRQKIAALRGVFFKFGSAVGREIPVVWLDDLNADLMKFGIAPVTELPTAVDPGQVQAPDVLPVGVEVEEADSDKVDESMLGYVQSIHKLSEGENFLAEDLAFALMGEGLEELTEQNVEDAVAMMKKMASLGFVTIEGEGANTQASWTDKISL
ncbi:MAG: hypothetical protein COX81_00695 [Candidatus Magasanikbacteria bacterium CG_4_10_14_0_2_um_filter_37_12]|uniref:Uncharacterized protein n=1 Tax=Candidatus Magasanikbacteria bacterium CG_4_10_14_0_2_um_filter_37_12 TaxID=1974637 RepID=A0A2M7V9N3_9BACT|nr:MAG: hypothetical protein COX81_00695 [Candidatus Magasanikbacteria bacterium CG_4_10_14_0_2_um_filter_37_12]